MAIHDSVELVAGVPLLVIVPALVELAKRHGLPVRYAGGAAIALAILLLILGDLALGTPRDGAGVAAAIARWIIGVSFTASPPPGSTPSATTSFPAILRRLDHPSLNPKGRSPAPATLPHGHPGACSDSCVGARRISLAAQGNHETTLRRGHDCRGDTPVHF